MFKSIITSMFPQKKQLKKIVRHNDLQVCLLDHEPIFFQLECDQWVQQTPMDNQLCYAIPSDPLIVYYIDPFLNGNMISITVKQLTENCYEPV